MMTEDENKDMGYGHVEDRLTKLKENWLHPAFLKVRSTINDNPWHFLSTAPPEDPMAAFRTMCCTMRWDKHNSALLAAGIARISGTYNTCYDPLAWFSTVPPSSADPEEPWQIEFANSDDGPGLKLTPKEMRPQRKGKHDLDDLLADPDPLQLTKNTADVLEKRANASLQSWGPNNQHNGITGVVSQAIKTLFCYDNVLVKRGMVSTLYPKHGLEYKVTAKKGDWSVKGTFEWKDNN